MFLIASDDYYSVNCADDETRSTLVTRKELYRHAALTAKRSGDMPTAAKYAKIAKQFDTVLTALDEGKKVDLNNMPPALSSSGSISMLILEKLVSIMFCFLGFNNCYF